jgi:hypothetical protein
MGSGFPHGPCSKGGTVSERGRIGAVESLILQGSWSWQTSPWASKSRSRARKGSAPALISAPRLTHIPSNDDELLVTLQARGGGKIYHPNL